MANLKEEIDRISESEKEKESGGSAPSSSSGGGAGSSRSRKGMKLFSKEVLLIVVLVLVLAYLIQKPILDIDFIYWIEFGLNKFMQLVFWIASFLGYKG